MLQRAGKTVKGHSKTKHYEQEKLDILTEAIVGYLFNAAAREFGYKIIDTNSFTKAEIFKKIRFSDIWFSHLEYVALKEFGAPQIKKLLI